MAPRRRGVRRRRAAVGARSRPGRDLERADSVTVDPHKWFFQAYDIGGLLVRDGAHLGQVFGGRAPEYYRGGETPRSPGDATTTTTTTATSSTSTSSASRAPAAGARSSCGCRGSISGREGSAGSSRPTTTWRLCSPAAAPSPTTSRRSRPTPELSVVCFRHLPGGRDAALALAPEELDAHQDRLQAALEASGDGWLTTTRLRGATWLRAGIVNYLSTETDIDRLLATLRRLAAARGRLAEASP